MTRIELKSRVGPDGMLSLRVPVGVEDANREVIVTVTPTEAARSNGEGLDEWRRFLDSIAGAWQGDRLVRPPQGEFEDRETWG